MSGATALGLLAGPSGVGPTLTVAIYILLFCFIVAGVWWVRYQVRWGNWSEDSAPGKPETPQVSAFSEYLNTAIVALGVVLLIGFGAAIVVPLLRLVVPFVALTFLFLIILYLFERPPRLGHVLPGSEESGK